MRWWSELKYVLKKVNRRGFQFWRNSHGEKFPSFPPRKATARQQSFRFAIA